MNPTNFVVTQPSGRHRLDPRRANYARFGRTYELVIAAIVLFEVALHVLLLRPSQYSGRRR